MLQAAQLSFGYSEAEDRISLRVLAPEGRILNILLTRRITRRLLAGLTDILARSSPILGRVSTDDRIEVMVLEHLGALSTLKPPSTTEGVPTPSVSQPSPMAEMESVLATRVHVQTLSDRFVLQLEATDGPRAEARLSRSEFHRLLSALDQYAERAEWNLKAETGWLSQTDQVMRGRNAAEAS